jgi:hypothetical protein
LLQPAVCPWAYACHHQLGQRVSARVGRGADQRYRAGDRTWHRDAYYQYGENQQSQAAANFAVNGTSGVYNVDAFPMTVTGKVQKFIMRERMIQELDLETEITA